MKETPPVLTAGPAAWIRQGGRERSRPLGTPRRAVGGREPRPRRAESTRGTPRVRSAVPGCLRAQLLRLGAGQPGPRPALGAAEGGAALAPSGRGAGRGGVRSPRSSSLHPEPQVAASAPAKLPNGNIRSRLAGRPAPRLRAPCSQGGPRRMRGALEAEARVGGLPSRFGSDGRTGTCLMFTRSTRSRQHGPQA